MSNERATTALQAVHDSLQQTTVIAQRRSQKILSEQSTSKTKGDAAYEAMDPSPNRVNDKKRRGASTSRSATRSPWQRQ